MKNQFRVSSAWNFTTLLTCLMSIFFLGNLNAQTFVPSSSLTHYFNNYPTSPTGSQWQPWGCASYRNARIGADNYDFYISSWKASTSVVHIVWRASLAGSPSTISSTGADLDFTITATGTISEIVTGIIETPTGYRALVAYNDVGSGANCGVILKTYDVSSTTPQLNITATTTLLYQRNNYSTRVEMDSWSQYASIVWAEIDPISSNTVIKCLPIDNGTFGAPVLLDNTNHGINPTTAVFFDNNTLNHLTLHFAYYDASTQDIIEIKTDWSSIWTASGSGYIVTPIVQDINILSSPAINPRPIIDCPINSGYENWAYSYVTSNAANHIYLRLFDSAGIAIPSTINLTNGSLGNTSISGRNNTWQSVCYEKSGDNLYVGWRSVNPITSDRNYACIQISSDGSTLLSAADYLNVAPNAIYSPNGISFSHNSDGPCLYVVSSYNNAAGNNIISHQFHDWSTTTSTFKKEEKNSIRNYFVTSWPNPFNNSVSIDVSSTLMNESVKVSLTDILGTTILSKEILGRDLNDLVNGYLPEMRPGSYWLKVSKTSFKYLQVLPLVKIGRK